MAQHSNAAQNDWEECPAGTLRELGARLRSRQRRRKLRRAAIPTTAVALFVVGSVVLFGLLKTPDDIGGITCQQLQQKLPLYLKGQLNAEDQESFEIHLASCPRCQDELKAIQAAGQTPIARDKQGRVPSGLLAALCRAAGVR